MRWPHRRTIPCNLNMERMIYPVKNSKTSPFAEIEKKPWSLPPQVGCKLKRSPWVKWFTIEDTLIANRIINQQEKSDFEPFWRHLEYGLNMGIWYLLQWLDNRKESNFEALKFECTNTLNNLSSIATKEHDNVFQHDHRLKHQIWLLSQKLPNIINCHFSPGPSPVGRLRNPGSGSGPIFRHIWDLYHHVLY